MAMPRTVTVADTLTQPDGTPEVGVVRFIQPVYLRSSGIDGMVSAGIRSAILDADGKFEINDLYAGDDPDWSPQSWPYTIEVALLGNRLRYQRTVPYRASPPYTLAELLPEVAVTPGELYAPVAHQHDQYATDAEVVELVDGQLANYPTEAEVGELLDGYATTATVEGVEQLAIDAGQAADTATTTAEAAAAAATAAAGVAAAAQTTANNALPKINPRVVNSTFRVGKPDDSAWAQWRSTGGSVDFDLHGDMNVSYDPDNGGALVPLMRWRGNGVTLVGRTEYSAVGFYGSDSVIEAGVRAILGGKNGADPMPFCGKWPGAFATLAGFWTAGDVLLFDDGWRECTASGQVGTWAIRS